MKTFKLIMLLFLGSISTLLAQNNEIQGVLKLPTIGATAPATPNGKVLSLDNNNNVIVTTAATGGGVNNNVFTIKSINSPANLGANVTVDNSSTFLNDAINAAIASPNKYKKIYIQEGVYLISNSIILNRTISTLSEGITIEGAGKNTILKPIDNFTATIPFFDISFSERNNIRNISIELKTSDKNVAKTAIQIGNGAQRNSVENLFIRGELTTPQVNATADISPILISANQTINATDESTKGFEADYNYFNNIFFQACPRSIVLDIKNSGVFNHNTFSNFHLDHFEIGIDFTSCSLNATIEGNLFSAFDCQALGPKDGENRLTSKYVVKGIMGANNTFQNFNIADWNGSQLVYVFEVTSNAERTVIENTECEGNITTGSDEKPNWYIDNGKGTQFINNASTNRITDYLLNNLNDVAFRGQNKEAFNNSNLIAKRNYFNVRDFGNVIFAGRNFNGENKTTESKFNIENYGNITIGNKTSDATFSGGSKTEIRGNLQFRPNDTDLSSTPGSFVLTNGGSNPQWGDVKWTSVASLPSNSIYNNDNWIKSSTQAIGGSTPTLVDNKLRTLYTQSGPYSGTDYNSTSVLFTRNGNPSFDIMYLYSGTRNTTGTALNNDQSVVIGANARTIATNTNNAGYKLIVNGKVKVKDEVYILNTVSHWADYVFQDDYKLKSLSEVEDFINENGHLPNMPSAKEIETNGIPMAEITTKQQEKIEELTLYIIEQNKKIEALQKMKEEMDSLKKLVEKLNKN